MKVKVSVTLEPALLRRIEGILFGHESRSDFFTDAAKRFAEKRERAQRDSHDLNANFDVLNKEAHENLALIADIAQELERSG